MQQRPVQHLAQTPAGDHEPDPACAGRHQQAEPDQTGQGNRRRDPVHAKAALHFRDFRQLVIQFLYMGRSLDVIRGVGQQIRDRNAERGGQALQGFRPGAPAVFNALYGAGADA